MTNQKLAELAFTTVEIVCKLLTQAKIPRVTTEQEMAIISSLAPVIFQELVAEEKAREAQEEAEW